MITETLHIGGMMCINCQNKIEQTLKKTDGVTDTRASFAKGTVLVTYDTAIVTHDDITKIIEKLDYKVLDSDSGSTPQRAEPALHNVLGSVAIIAALFMLMRNAGAGVLTGAFPLAESGMSGAALLLIGVITSVHCVAMCGGINLSQCMPCKPQTLHPSILPSILYNGGRVVSYAVTGAIVGAIGSVITVTGAMRGVVQLAAGVFMVIMGIKMLGIFPALRRFVVITPNVSRFFGGLANKAQGKSPLIVGLLNGLMPCGPLQAMQLYALSTGSLVSGAISMFLFGLGTVPLMFAMGAVSSLLSRKFTNKVMSAGAMLVAALGLTMVSNGWALSGVDLPSTGSTAAQTASFRPRIENGVQIVESVLSPSRYPAITVQVGIPVKWIINAPPGSINGCNNRMIVRQYGIEHQFKAGDNIIEFMPDATGKFSYSCWMGMIRSSITVASAGQTIIPDTADANVPTSAGVQIPVDNITLAEMQNGYQTVSVNLTDDGIEPALIVMQKNIPTLFVVNNNSLDAGGSALIFPFYYAQLPLSKGPNEIQLLPTADFDFSTIDNIFYAYVKVVDDIGKIDASAEQTIKNEAANFETLIYPQEYFADSGGMSCCR
ncbi:MAG: sulfite exporter TauE/SafE family protein [Termitinemataceae bacterium]|nr:MAG: sulfite exporter TauE/SafE family protein [Termitinemataceae bacterium]